MKKKLFALPIILASLLMLASCGGENETKETTIEVPTTTKETTTKKEENTTTTKRDTAYFTANGIELTEEELKSELKKTSNVPFYGFTMDDFTNVLPMPNTTVETDDSFAAVESIRDILDYAVFYHIEQISITFKGDNKNITNEEFLNMGYWSSRLLVSIVNFTYTFEGNDFLLTFLYNEEANMYSSKEIPYESVGLPYTFYSTLPKRSDDFDDFGYKSFTNGTVDVYNSDQLFYVLENKYIPNCLEGSPAEKVMNKAKDILRNIIYDDMTILDKETAIDAWILSNATYAPAEEYAIFQKDENHPDEVMSMLQGAYIEGIFDAKEGVCHGFAKVLSLLSSIEGIDNEKVSSPIHSIDAAHTQSSFADVKGARSYQSHGYVYVRGEDDKYYICDPTYSYFYNSYYPEVGKEMYIFREFACMMDYETWTDLYQNQSVDWFNFNNKAKIGTISLDYKGNFFMKNKDITMDLSLDTIEEVDSFVANLKEYIQNYNNSYYSSNHLYLLNVYPKDELLDYATEKLNEEGYTILFERFASAYPDFGVCICFA